MHLALISIVALGAASLVGCATQSSAQHHVGVIGAPERRVVELPGSIGAGQPREVRALVDEPALKLVSIVLRGGTVLPTHHSAVPVTIMALQGSGAVVVGSERLRLDSTHAVVLAAGVPHAVEPDQGTDLALLVHHLGRGEEHHP